MIDYFSLHRRKDIWGEDADEFVPERWIAQPNLDRELSAKYQFVPFGVGPRVCLGRESSRNPRRYALVLTVQQSKWQFKMSCIRLHGLCKYMEWRCTSVKAILMRCCLRGRSCRVLQMGCG